MKKFNIGDKVLIKDKRLYGYICDDTDSKVGHYIVDCYDFMDTKDSNEFLIDVDVSDIEVVND
ncbi:MAG: hypothetical protein ACOX4I_02695 [Anaerovoracaceae bacterium]|jgi:hypothetical protein